ncbi:MAG: hypothetical protein ABIJ86_15075 [Spirochaetota bacterium]
MYQGYLTITDTDAVEPVASGGGAASVFVPTLIALKVDGAERYYFQIAQDAIFSSIDFENDALSSNEYTPTDWTDPATTLTYYWRVKVYKNGIWGSWSTNLATFSLLVPSAGTVIPAQGATTTQARPSLDWSDIPGAASYRIQIATSDTFTTTLVNDEDLPSSAYVHLL